METKGIELPANSAQKRHFDEARAQNPAHAGMDDPDLAWLVKHWSAMPELIRKQIAAIARSA